jgi:hypothetical protein
MRYRQSIRNTNSNAICEALSSSPTTQFLFSYSRITRFRLDLILTITKVRGNSIFPSRLRHSSSRNKEIVEDIGGSEAQLERAAIPVSMAIGTVLGIWGDCIPFRGQIRQCAAANGVTISWRDVMRECSRLKRGRSQHRKLATTASFVPNSRIRWSPIDHQQLLSRNDS